VFAIGYSGCLWKGSSCFEKAPMRWLGSTIERIVYAGPSRRVVDLGRRSRFFTGALRRAIQLRDRRCVVPGCDDPADDCDVDHRLPYTKDGRTDQNNGDCKCGHHNRHKSDTVQA
jgi:hypothetical protein